MLRFDHLNLRRGAKLLFSDANFTLHAGWKVGVTGGTLALLLNADTTKALEATGTLLFAVDGFGTATGTATVKWNTTGVDFSAAPQTIEIDGISADLTMGVGTVASPLQSVSVVGLNVEILGFVTLGGACACR